MSETFGPKAFMALDEQVRSNIQMFTEAMKVFTPFANKGSAGKDDSEGPVRDRRGGRYRQSESPDGRDAGAPQRVGQENSASTKIARSPVGGRLAVTAPASRR